MSTASAHDPTTALDLIWADSTSEFPASMYSNRGLIFPYQESTFELRCYAAYSSSSTQVARVVPRGDGSLVLGTYLQVRTTDDMACTFETASGLPNLSLSPLVATGTELILSSRTLSEPTRLYRSSDDGVTFTPTFEVPADTYFDELFVAPSDPTRIYANVVRTIDGTRQYACAMSQDGGATWAIEQVDDYLTPFAVDPIDPNIVYAYQGTDAQLTVYRVLRSQSGCSNFQSILEGAKKPQALTGLGDSRWLGFANAGGLYRSDDSGQTFQRSMEDTVITVSCLETRGDRLWICGTIAPNTRGVWYIDPGETTLTKYMTMDEVVRPVPCASGADRATCATDWYDFYKEEHPDENDGGVEDASMPELDANVVAVEDAGAQPTAMADAGAPNEGDSGSPAPEPVARSAGCGCGVKRSSPGSWLVALLGLGLAVGLRRQRRGRALAHEGAMRRF